MRTGEGSLLVFRASSVRPNEAGHPNGARLLRGGSLLRGWRPSSPCGACRTQVTSPMTSGNCWNPRTAASPSTTEAAPTSAPGAERVVAVDVTGPPGWFAGGARLHPREPGQRTDAGAPEPAGRHRPAALVLVDRGDTAVAARTLGRHPDLAVRRVGWDDKQPTFRPVRHAWRVEVAHGRLGRFRRLAKSFENTTTSATGWLPGTSPPTPAPAQRLTDGTVRSDVASY
jgi:hypothetical protein